MEDYDGRQQSYKELSEELVQAMSCIRLAMETITRLEKENEELRRKLNQRRGGE